MPSQNPLLQDDPRYAFASPDNALAPQPTWADAAQWHAQNLADTWSAVQNPQTWVDAAGQYGNALLMGTTAPKGMPGSPIAAKWATQGDQLGLTSTYKPKADDTPLVVYHGLKQGYDAAGHMFVTTDRSGAEFHGPVTAYEVRPGAKIFADLEAGKKETGLETLFNPGGSSAIVHRDDLIPLAVQR